MTGAQSPGPSLLVFAKEPVPGTVKTRLAAALGEREAAAVYRELTEATLAQAGLALHAGVVGRIELWCTPDPDSDHFRRLAARFGATLHLQQGDDLGERMAGALIEALSRADRALLIGTDCPALDVGYLAQASDALAAHDAVLGPAQDGGYVLVGARRPLAFAGVRFSTRDALADTRAAFARAGIRCTELPTSWDVDDAADLDRWRALRTGTDPTTDLHTR